MSNTNIKQNDIHPLFDVAHRLITIFQTATRYQPVISIENSVKCNFIKLNKVLLGTIHHDIVQRVKQHFDIILETIITSFIHPRARQNAMSWKPFVQETFDSIVEYTINVESRLLLDKKQDLLADLHTQLTNEMTSQMLMNRLLPTYVFKSEYKLEEMARRQNEPSRFRPDTRCMNNRTRFNEKQNQKLERILTDISRKFGIALPVMIEMIKHKKQRNDTKHYDKRIRAHVKTHQGRPKQLRSFLKTEGLLHAFDDIEIERSQKMYFNHCEIIRTDWHDR
jgi:hypothetical protein